MSWSIGVTGKKEDVMNYLNNEAPKAIAHVTGAEREIADKALDLARATVGATITQRAVGFNVSGFGSALFEGGQGVPQEVKQTAQAVKIEVSLQY